MARSFSSRPSNEFVTFRAATKERVSCNCMTHGDSTSQTVCMDRRISASERARITRENVTEIQFEDMAALDYAFNF